MSLRTRPPGTPTPTTQQPGLATLGPFTDDQFQLIRTGRMTGWLITANQRPPKPGKLRPLRKLTIIRDGDGNPTGEIRPLRMTAPITITAVSRPIDLTLQHDNLTIHTRPRLALTDQHAHICGHQTADQLRTTWQTRHPRTPIVRLVEFAYHDTRNPDYYLDTINGYTLTPARSIDPDAPTVPKDAQEWITRNANATDQARTTKTRQDQAARSLAIRLKDAGRRRDPNDIRAIAAAATQLADELEQAA